MISTDYSRMNESRKMHDYIAQVVFITDISYEDALDYFCQKLSGEPKVDDYEVRAKWQQKNSADIYISLIDDRFKVIIENYGFIKSIKWKDK